MEIKLSGAKFKIFPVFTSRGKSCNRRTIEPNMTETQWRIYTFAFKIQNQNFCRSYRPLQLNPPLQRAIRKEMHLCINNMNSYTTFNNDNDVYTRNRYGRRRATFAPVPSAHKCRLANTKWSINKYLLMREIPRFGTYLIIMYVRCLRI